jgi:hypothetical protein
MKKLQMLLQPVFAMVVFTAAAQTSAPVNPAVYITYKHLFSDDKPIELELMTNFKNLHSPKQKEQDQDAAIVMHLSDSLEVRGTIGVYARGGIRRTICRTPGIMMNFHNISQDKNDGVKKIKLVCGCSTGAAEEQFLLKEYLVYRIYNLLTELSLRVRLARVTYKDIKNTKNTYTQYAFMIEDVKDLSKRLGCREVKKRTYLTEQTDRKQMTLVAIFQYMIGNTDWAVPNYHNIRLIRLASDSTSAPYTIPYDFDFTGLVNPPNATTAPELDLINVQQRKYRGFPRNMDELQSTLNIFREQKEKIYTLIKTFDLLNPKQREQMIRYLDEFYDDIDNKRVVKSIFIDGARSQ